LSERKSVNLAQRQLAVLSLRPNKSKSGVAMRCVHFSWFQNLFENIETVATNKKQNNAAGHQVAGIVNIPALKMYGRRPGMNGPLNPNPCWLEPSPDRTPSDGRTLHPVPFVAPTATP
jgi:hypothetical protein